MGTPPPLSPRKFHFGRRPGYGGTVIVAPHCDDAAFSLGGSLLDLAIPKPITLITLCVISDHMHDKSGWPVDAVTRIRIDEERYFSFRLGIDLKLFALRDAAIEREGQVVDPTGTARFSEAIQRRLKHEIRLKRPRLILLPMGLGHHWDHVASRNSLGHMDAVMFYEDLPYAAHLRCVDTAAEAFRLHLAPVTVHFSSGTLVRKLALTKIYKSQISAATSELLRKQSLRLCRSGGERLWWPVRNRPVLRNLSRSRTSRTGWWQLKRIACVD